LRRGDFRPGFVRCAGGDGRGVDLAEDESEQEAGDGEMGSGSS
jgi:hypothetical protein